MYTWPLAKNNFSIWDRLKICGFFLNPNNRWTNGPRVIDYENALAKYVGCRYAVFVSSGSSANALIAQYTKDKLVKSGEWPWRNRVICNALTWQTNVSVWLREGFEPIFIDVNLNDFCLDYDKLEEVLKTQNESIACVFPTAVLGYTPNIELLKQLAARHNVKLALDCCENLFGSYSRHEGVTFDGGIDYKTFNICSEITSSTSMFIAHQISTGQEGGAIFTNDKDEYKYYLMARAHGLYRNLLPYTNGLAVNDECSRNWLHYETEVQPLQNKLVNPQFDFQVLSSNYRSSDIVAYMGLLDFRRVHKYKQYREDLYEIWRANLDGDRYYLPSPRSNVKDCVFCLMLICKDVQLLQRVTDYLIDNGIEYRPIISGTILRHKCYKSYGNYNDYPNSEYLTKNGLYIGANMNIKPKRLTKLAADLNQL